MTNNTFGNTEHEMAFQSDDESMSEASFEFDEESMAEEGKIIVEIIEAFEKSKQAELAEYTWYITLKLLQLTPIYNFTYSRVDTDNTRTHSSSLFVASVCYLLATFCYHLKMYAESLRYLYWAESNLSLLNANDSNRCLQNCVKHVLIVTHQQLYSVKVAMGKRDEAVVHLRKVLAFLKLMMNEGSVEHSNAYKETYEAYLAVMVSQQALPLRLKNLDICISRNGENSREVALLRVELAVLYHVVEEYGEAVKETQLWQSVLKNTDSSSEFVKAELESAMKLFNFCKYKDAIDVLQVVVSRTDTEEGGRVTAFLTMAAAACKLENFGDARNYMTAAETILKENDLDPIFVALVRMDMAELYEHMNDLETAISLSKSVWEISLQNYQKTEIEVLKLGYLKFLGESSTKLFSLIPLAGRVKEEMLFMIDVAEKLEPSFGLVHNELGYVCAKFGASLIKSGQDDLAVKMITKAKDIMDVAFDPQHVDSLKTSHTLSGIYEKLGRYNEAVKLQVKVVEGIKGLEPSEQQFKDEAVRQLDKLRGIVAKSTASASSPSPNTKDDLSA